MKRIKIDKKINKKVIKKKENIDYKKDKPPHW